jgi:hypothetical protein
MAAITYTIVDSLNKIDLEDALGDVKLGISYGADGTEFTGTLIVVP